MGRGYGQESMGSKEGRHGQQRGQAWAGEHGQQRGQAWAREHGQQIGQTWAGKRAGMDKKARAGGHDYSTNCTEVKMF
jgi:hypothetical protein